jgi:Domain of unknown function (DUF5615)
MTSNWLAFRSVSLRWVSSDGWPCNVRRGLVPSWVGVPAEVSRRSATGLPTQTRSTRRSPPPSKPGCASVNSWPGKSVTQPLLLDEMFTEDIAQQLRTKGYDVISVVANTALVGLPDDQILAYATAEGRALVTANIRDFIPLDTHFRAADQAHAGLILVSTKTFPQSRGFPSAVTTALAVLLRACELSTRWFSVPDDRGVARRRRPMGQRGPRAPPQA